MIPRLLALVLLLAVLPTVELAEQVAHAALHVVNGEAPDHSAHHDEGRSDEHGCTGLVHLCGHHAQVMTGPPTTVVVAIEVGGQVALEAPRSLVDQRSPEPAQRPPIAA